MMFTAPLVVLDGSLRFTLSRLTLLVQARVIWRFHVHHVHMLPKQLDDLIQLLVVAVAVYEDFKLGIAPLGLPGLYVHKVDVAFL